MTTKYPRTYHLPFSPGTTSDDRIAKDFSNLIGKRIIITEKLDGENNAITKDGVYARSHVDFTRNPWAVKTKEIQSNIGRLLADGEYVFGENMYAVHSIEYSGLKSPFYMFGFRRDGMWYSWDDLIDLSFILGLHTVPVLFDGVVHSEQLLQALVEKFVSEESSLGSPIKEGVVCRVADSFPDEDFGKSVMKWVRRGHVQTDQHWTRNWRKSKIDYTY